MVEALAIVLLLGFLAAFIASIVGVVIGVRRKQWRLAIITGSVSGALFVLFVIAAVLSDFEGSDSGVTERELAVAEPAPTPVQQESPPQVSAPTAVPEPTLVSPTPEPGLGVTRDEVQKRFEKDFAFRELTFQTSEATDGTPTAVGFFDNKRTMIVLEGADELFEVSVVFTIEGGSKGDFQDQMDTVYLLGDLILPEWDERRDWVHEVLAYIGKHNAADFEATQGDKRVAFSYAASRGQALYTIKLERFAMSAPAIIPESPPVPVAGLGISRDQIHSFLENFGYDNVKKEDCPGSPCTSVSASNPSVEIWLYGPDDALHQAMAVGDTRENDTATGEATAYMLNAIMPDSSEAVIDWILTDAAESLDRKGGGGIEQTFIGGNEVILGVGTRTGALTLTIRD